MYQNVAAAGQVPAHIMFFYTENMVFNNVMIRSMYRAKTIKDGNGESQIDEYALSEDEKDAFVIFIKKAIHDAFNHVMKMTTGVPDALILGQTGTEVFAATLPDGVLANDIIYGFMIKDHEAYNENNIALVDEGIKNLIEANIMREWYEMVGHDAETAKMYQKYQAIKSDLITKRLFQLRKPLIN